MCLLKHRNKYISIIIIKNILEKRYKSWLAHRRLCRVKNMLAGPKNTTRPQGRMQDSKLGGGGAHLKNFFWGISCEKSRFYAKKSYFFQILGGGAHRVPPPPPGSAPGPDSLLTTTVTSTPIYPVKISIGHKSPTDLRSEMIFLQGKTVFYTFLPSTSPLLTDNIPILLKWTPPWLQKRK